MTNPTDRIIVALDRISAAANLDLIGTLGDLQRWYKVGLRLFIESGPRFVEQIRGLDKRVFLDLKLHDIPSTVAGAVQSAGALGVELMTLHAAGGGPMLEAAARAAQTFGSDRPKLLAVTVLTSQPDLGDTRERVVRRARLAIDSGCDGVVCSPLEARAVREVLGTSALIVTPGVRLPNSKRTDDQARVASPDWAIDQGADLLVVGRPIHQAPDPSAALAAFRAALSR